MEYSWILKINNAMEREEINNIEIYRLKFNLKQHVSILHMTSVNTRRVQVTHGAVGARTMHRYVTDSIWGSGNLVGGEPELGQLICILW